MSSARRAQRRAQRRAAPSKAPEAPAETLGDLIDFEEPAVAQSRAASPYGVDARSGRATAESDVTSLADSPAGSPTAEPGRRAAGVDGDVNGDVNGDVSNDSSNSGSGSSDNGDNESDASGDDESDASGEFAILGGRERAVGGWVDYEADRRELQGARGAGRQTLGAYGGGSSDDEAEPVVTALDAAESLLAAVPGTANPRGKANKGATGGGQGSGSDDDDDDTIPHAAAAALQLDSALSDLQRASSQPAWWDAHDRVTLPAEDLVGLAREVTEAGSASPEHLAALASAAETALANAAPDADSVELRRALPAVEGLISTAMSERKRLTRIALARRTASDLHRVERAALPYARQMEVLNARVAAAAERAAGTLQRANDG